MGESLEVNMYDRFTALEVEDTPVELEGYGSVQAGDCIVAFSRRDIYAIKAQIEAESKLKACVVYGALPPETRRNQVQLTPIWRPLPTPWEASKPDPFPVGLVFFLPKLSLCIWLTCWPTLRLARASSQFSLSIHSIHISAELSGISRRCVVH
jgi:hypothetical protein